ncbi:MAG TPA: transcriptional repressor, partial [Devosiaceae bacterium]|nr:transcriptional repressor [Devosiaceae bacterium]
LNAFVACADHEKGHWAAFTICQTCGAVGEAPVGDPAALANGLDLGDFDVKAAQLELRGICGSCRDRGPS